MRGLAHLNDQVAHWCGSPLAVLGSIALVLGWAVCGPFFSWSEGHQLFINTVTTVITFWLVFVIQATQNRDTAALHAKLDEMIRVSDASNRYIGLDRQPEEEIERMRDLDA